MALFQKNGVQLNMAILDLSKSFDANSLCSSEEITWSFHVYCKRGQQSYTTVPQGCHLIFRGVSKDDHGTSYLLQSIISFIKVKQTWEKKKGEREVYL